MQKEDLSKLGFEEKPEGQEEAKEDKTRYGGKKNESEVLQKWKMLTQTPSFAILKTETRNFTIGSEKRRASWVARGSRARAKAIFLE
jgi:hypothetical protein